MREHVTFYNVSSEKASQITDVVFISDGSPTEYEIPRLHHLCASFERRAIKEASVTTEGQRVQLLLTSSDVYISGESSSVSE